MNYGVKRYVTEIHKDGQSVVMTAVPMGGRVVHDAVGKADLWTGLLGERIPESQAAMHAVQLTLAV